MNNFKFRIWMYYQERFLNNYTFQDFSKVSFPIESWGQVQQYTGLKDKNGVEIYEGDICKCRGLAIVETVLVEDIRKIPVQISAWPTIYGKENGECEVIGNIYQNPELLKN